MSTLQRLAAITETAANLIAQLRELNELREQVRKAELSAWRSRPVGRRKMNFNGAPSVNGTASSPHIVSIETTVGE
jgi:hypothetical protein